MQSDTASHICNIQSYIFSFSLELCEFSLLLSSFNQRWPKLWECHRLSHWFSLLSSASQTGKELGCWKPCLNMWAPERGRQAWWAFRFFHEHHNFQVVSGHGHAKKKYVINECILHFSLWRKCNAGKLLTFEGHEVLTLKFWCDPW